MDNTQINTTSIGNTVREYENIVHDAKLEGVHHPGRVYVTLRELYSPILYLGRDEYASHLPPIPEWLWLEIKKTAGDRYEYQTTRRRNRMHIPNDQIQMWKRIMDGKPPYDMPLLRFP